MILFVYSEMQNLNQVLMSIIHGAVEIPDPQSQKSCFSILRRLIEVWGKALCTFLTTQAFRRLFFFTICTHSSSFQTFSIVFAE